LTHGQKARPGFNPCACEVKTWLVSQAFAFTFDLCRYVQDALAAATANTVGLYNSKSVAPQLETAWVQTSNLVSNVSKISKIQLVPLCVGRAAGGHARGFVGGGGGERGRRRGAPGSAEGRGLSLAHNRPRAVKLSLISAVLSCFKASLLVLPLKRPRYCRLSLES
jgi:hypothetical protein